MLKKIVILILNVIALIIILFIIKLLSLKESIDLIFFICILSSWIIITISITLFLEILFPNKNFRKEINFKKASKNEKKEFWLISFPILITILILCALYTSKIYQIIAFEVRNELKINGLTKNSVIYHFGYKGKGSQYTYYKFYHNNIEYTNTISRIESHKINDSIMIIYSTKLPHINMTLEKYIGK